MWWRRIVIHSHSPLVMQVRHLFIKPFNLRGSWDSPSGLGCSCLFKLQDLMEEGNTLVILLCMGVRARFPLTPFPFSSPGSFDFDLLFNLFFFSFLGDFFELPPLWGRLSEDKPLAGLAEFISSESNPATHSYVSSFSLPSSCLSWQIDGLSLLPASWLEDVSGSCA